MARRERGLKPLLRSIVRERVRSGATNLEITEEIEDRFDRRRTRTLSRMIEEERIAQANVDELMGPDRRRQIDLTDRFCAGDKDAHVMARITLTWRDEDTGLVHSFDNTVELQKSGAVQTIINRALRQVLEDARGRKYQPPHITSSMVSGKAFYRLEYVECR